MTTELPQVNKTGRYPIGKAAELLDIARTTLLRHAEQGLIRYCTQRGSHRKIFLGSEILRYWSATI